MNQTLQFLVIILCCFHGAYAQEKTTKTGVDLEEIQSEIRQETRKIRQEEKAVQEKSQGFEKVEVTGSHIKRIDVEGPSPILTIDNDDLVRSGYNSVADVLRDTGVNSFGSFREHAGLTGAGTAAVDLRGLGQVRTLVLLNGKRLPTDAIGGAVDLNIIPMGAVERVEILKDGASAIYGSDALGGVVNIITKKNFEGHEFGSSFSVTEQAGGERRDLSYINGFQSGKISSTSVFYMRHNERVLAQDREWSKFGQSPTSTAPAFKTPGDSTWTPSQECDPENVLANGRCAYNFGAENWEMPYIRQGAMMNETTYEVNDTMQALSRVSYSYKETDWITSPASVFLGNVRDPKDGTQKDIVMRLGDLGNRSSSTVTQSGMVLTGLRGEWGETWEWESSLSYNKVDRQETRGGYARTSDLKNAYENGTWDPLAAPGQRGSIAGLGYNPEQDSISENTFFDAKTSGEVGTLGAGPIMMAFGVQAFRELYRDGSDPETAAGNIPNIAASSGGGARNSASVFTEANFQFIESLETSAALRYDQFEGFGSTVNPKLGFRYAPMRELMFRASAGTGFKAPQMQKLYSGQSQGLIPFIDQVHCQKSPNSDGCNPSGKLAVIGGNRDLKEETSVSFNIGSVVQPSRDHSFGFDFWHYDLNDVVSEPNYGALTRLEAEGVDISKFGAVSERDPNTGELIGDGLYAPFLNISSIKTQGLDFNYDGKVRTQVGRFRLRFQHSHMLYYQTEALPGTGIIDQVGGYGRPQWRNNTTLFYEPHKNHELSVLARTIASNEKVVAAAGRHPTYTEYDLRYNWNIESLEGRLTFGIKNLLGSLPPFDDSNPNDADINFRLYDERGRSAYLGYRQIF